MSPVASRLLLVAIAGMTAAACGGAKPGAPLSPVGADARLWRDDGGGIPDSAAHVIRDAGAMREFWSRATSAQASPPPLPDIDFRRQMVVIVAAGRMSPEDEIRIDSIGVRSDPVASGGREDVLAVQYTITVNCSRFPGDVFPVEVVRVSRFQGEVRFIGRRDRGANCD